MAGELIPFLRGGKTARDLDGLQSPFVQSLTNLITSAPPNVRASLGIVSAYRSPERQKQLYDQALAKYGSPEAARKWVAPPGRSNHNHGAAVDLTFGPKDTPEYDAARQWAHANAGQHGLAFPMSHEPWHIEPVGARGDHAHKTLPGAPAPAPGPNFGLGGPQSPSTRVLMPADENAPALAPPAPPAPPDTGPGSGLGLGTALVAAIGAMAKGPGSTAMKQVALPAPPDKPVNLAAILNGQGSPLLIGRPA